GGASNTPRTISVILTVNAITSPTIDVTPTSFIFNAPAGGVPPAGQMVTISNSGGGTLNWTWSASDPWLSLSIVGGGALGAGASATPNILVDQSLAANGANNGTITITDPPSSNVSVQL